MSEFERKKIADLEKQIEAVKEIIYSFNDATKKILLLTQLFPPVVNVEFLEKNYPLSSGKQTEGSK